MGLGKHRDIFLLFLNPEVNLIGLEVPDGRKFFKGLLLDRADPLVVNNDIGDDQGQKGNDQEPEYETVFNGLKLEVYFNFLIILVKSPVKNSRQLSGKHDNYRSPFETGLERFGKGSRSPPEPGSRQAPGSGRVWKI